MTEPNTLTRAAQSARAHTNSYANDPAFRRRWSGLSEVSRNYGAQQRRVFGELVGTVTDSLATWNILDVGCSDGHWLRAMSEFGASPLHLVGVDVSEDRFDVGRIRSPHISLLPIDGHTLPFQNDSFDLIMQWVCFSNIPTLALRRRMADEMRRVLKPGGYIFWWDLSYMTAPSELHQALKVNEYFDWSLQTRYVAQLPYLDEVLRPRLRWLRPIARLFRWVGYPPSHVAALIGPKPTGKS